MEILGLQKDEVPSNTGPGALLNHISGGADHKSFQPMNVNFGLFDPIDSLESGRKARKQDKAYTDRAKSLWKEGLKPLDIKEEKELGFIYVCGFLDKVYKAEYKDPRDLYRDWVIPTTTS